MFVRRVVREVVVGYIVDRYIVNVCLSIVFCIFIYTHLPVPMCLLRKAFPHHSKYWSVKRPVNYKCPWRLLHQLCVGYIDNTTG